MNCTDHRSSGIQSAVRRNLSRWRSAQISGLTRLVGAAAVLTAVWARAAARAAGEVEDARRMRDTIAHAAECLPDEELLDFLNTFLGGPPAPTADEEPTPEEAPRS